MYRMILRRRVRNLYRALNAGNHRPLLDGLSRDFAYTFVGDDHPLAGTRRSRAAMEAYFARVFRLFPGISFTPGDVIVNGWPWNTRVGVALEVRAQLQDGSSYSNDIIQLLWIRWGRASQVRTIIDTARLDAAYRRLVAAGIAEAAAGPIIERAPSCM